MRGLPPVWLHRTDELYSNQRGPARNLTILATAYSDPAREAHWGVLTHGTGDHEPMVYNDSLWRRPGVRHRDGPRGRRRAGRIGTLAGHRLRRVRDADSAGRGVGGHRYGHAVGTADVSDRGQGESAIARAASQGRRESGRPSGLRHGMPPPARWERPSSEEHKEAPRATRAKGPGRRGRTEPNRPGPSDVGRRMAAASALADSPSRPGRTSPASPACRAAPAAVAARARSTGR